MILIADSGSSKTAWRGIDSDGEIHQWTGVGINPLHLDDAAILSILEDTLPNSQGISEVYFYGAGCVAGPASDRMANVLKNYFRADVEVADDMLAVARGVCGHEPGIACILGTGSNSCAYDGQNISGKVPALGFILGDEGSGSWLGKQLLAAYYRDELPSIIRERMEKRFDMARESVLRRVYKEERPAAFLAAFSKFIFQNREEPYLYRLIYEGFIQFLDKNVCKYENYTQLPVHFSGSVAFYYSTILRKACADRGLTVKNIVEGPIAGLTLYHRNK